MKLHNYQVIGVQKHHEVRGFGSSPPLPGSDELENALDVDEMKEEEDVEDLFEGGRGEVFKTSWNPLRVIKQTIYYVHLYHLYAIYLHCFTNAKGPIGSTAEHPNFFQGNRAKGLGLSFPLQWPPQFNIRH